MAWQSLGMRLSGLNAVRIRPPASKNPVRPEVSKGGLRVTPRLPYLSPNGFVFTSPAYPNSIGSGLPHVLAGPLLRKVTPDSVTVWFALQKKATAARMATQRYLKRGRA
jgi:hypothetical protein